MAKFLVELLGCTLPNKGTPPLFEYRSQSHLGMRPRSKQQAGNLCARHQCTAELHTDTQTRTNTLIPMVNFGPAN
ncbi:ras-GEF domain-containing family member 1B-A-like [Antennarius striatus]|uniref:ras-GEF domain-containing family member 1B-A-like n=1 Tax=Antennarius striatus TaxID=241820 RepID=UPI0035B43982